VAPSAGSLGKPNNQLWVDLTTKHLSRDLHEYYLKCIFDKMIHRLKDEFVGDVQDL
jgi:hypothetical protein